MRRGNSLVYDLHSGMKSLRGYSIYWLKTRSDLLAINRSLGPPHWFVTISSRDLEWLDMLMAMAKAKQRTDPNFKISVDSSFEERANLLKEFPVIASRHFNRRFGKLLNYIMRSEVFIKKVADYWYRVEFQERVSPHIHMLLWCADMPSFNTPEGVSLIEMVIHCQKITNDDDLNKLIDRLQTHGCRKNCFPEEKPYCKFGLKMKVVVLEYYPKKNL